jgi:hypothetical protein
MNKKKLIFIVVLSAIVIVALVRGIILGDPADMRMEASGL